MNILQAIDDPNVFAGAFREKESWKPWRAFLAALFGLGMDQEGEAIYRHCAARQNLPVQPFNEAWLVCGRRGGKSQMMALIAVYLAIFRDYRPYLSAGERVIVFVVAADKKQAKVVLRYVQGLLHHAPALERLIEAEREESIDLSNSVSIEVAIGRRRIV